uniref:Cytochrome P450 2U1-like n=1 Tax=Phallusia mammillata TaxID=59560 RepID=A0A6F9D9Q8_9ASCI|nr:cytochrome P450 2U1-like [Phallusia mammillata]
MLNMYLIVFTFLVILFFYWWYQKPEKFPPGPRGIPLFGIIPFLSNFPEKDFGAWSRKYGPIISVPMAWQNCVVLNDYETVIETLVKRNEEFSERPHIRLFHMFSKNGVVLIPGGPVWRAHRRFGTTSLRRFGGNKGIIERKINDEAMHLVHALKECEGKPFDIKNIMTNTVSNVICNMAFGRRYDYSDEKFQVLVSNILGFFKNLSDWKSNLVIFFPFLCDFPPFAQHVKETVALLGPIKALIADLINEHKSNFDPNDIRDILDGYLENFVDKKDDFVLEHCQDFCFDLFVAGTETSSTTLRWACLCLMLNPDVQEKMLEEIDHVIGKEGTPSVSHREKMPFSCAVLHEVMRFRTMLPLSLSRNATKDVTVRGLHIPKGTQVFANLWQVHNDETYWKNPNKFEPQRHLDENGNFTNSRYVIPFGAGARVCMGEHLARTQLWVFLINIVQRFRISVDPNDPDLPSLDDGTNAIVHVPPAYNMIIHSR